MEATKKTPATRAALLVVAAISMLLSGLFIATASRSDASPPPACPDGFNLTADEKNCYQPAVITTSDNPNTCEKGLLTPDNTQCYVAATVLAQEGTTSCPDGYSPDDSLNGMCARYIAATEGTDDCPANSQGTYPNCYIRVAKAAGGGYTCDGGATTQDSNQCTVDGDAPVRDSACPTSSTVLLEGNVCYSVVSRESGTAECKGEYAPTSGVCKVTNPNPVGSQDKLDWKCPATVDGEAISETTTTLGSDSKIESCVYTPKVPAGDCPTGDSYFEADGECRRLVTLQPGPYYCEQDGYIVSGSKCVKISAATAIGPACPADSYELNGECRQNVSAVTGPMTCPDDGSVLSGESCVYTTGFLVESGTPLYKCDEGTRAVVGDQVICMLGASQTNTSTAPTCMQGVISDDNLYCVVPRIDAAPAAAAPRPAFTG